MQTGIYTHGNPKVTREQLQKGIRLNRPRGRFGVSERVGSGAHCSKLSYVPMTDAVAFMFQRALDYKAAGYKAEWFDGATWFIATCEGKPDVFCVLTEGELMEFTYEDLTVVERWLTIQIDELNVAIVEPYAEIYADIDSLCKERDVFDDYRETVRIQLEALNDFAVKQAIAKHEVKS